MLLQKTEIEKIMFHRDTRPLVSADYLLFSVRNSSGKLCSAYYIEKMDAPPYQECYGSLLLNGIPLIRLQSNGCPTCNSLIAAGYELPQNSKELKQICSSLNQPYTGLDDALNRLRPVIGLLQPGIYTLSYSEYYPTDGDGRFFWDAKEGLTEYQATAELFDSSNLCCLPSYPCFFYPSQSYIKYDPARVGYYRKRIRAGKGVPPVLAFFISGYLSVLLDGHHRACACALEGVNVPCLTLAEPEVYAINGVSHFAWPDQVTTICKELAPKFQKMLDKRQQRKKFKPSLPLSAQVQFCYSWPAEYASAVKRYPTCWEAGLLGLYSTEKLDAGGLQMMVQNTERENISSMAKLLLYAARQPGVDPKKLGMAFIGQENPYELRCAAYKALDQIKDDTEIDDLMVQILVDGDNKDELIYRIADQHWAGITEKST